MDNIADTISLKTVGANGQISLGKKHAGRHVIVEEQAEGVWLVRTARVVPDNEAWLHTATAARDLHAALDHAAATVASPANADAILDRATLGR